MYGRNCFIWQKGSDLTNLITLQNVTKTYKGSRIPAIESVGFEVPEGEFFCLVGESGCGKSTVLKLIAGIEMPTSGKVEVSGKVGMVFQSGGLFPWLTVKQNIEFGMKMSNFSKQQIYTQTEKYMRLVDLQQFSNKYPRELSGGQKQRVGLARALAIEPQILLLDEPFSALDTVTTEELHMYLLQIWQQTHKTIVMVSHLLEEAYLLSDRIGVMNKGRLTEIFKVDGKRPRKENHGSYAELMEKIKKGFVV